MFNFPLKNMLGFNNTKVSLKGKDADNASAFMAHQVAATGQISENQARGVNGVDSLLAEMRAGFRQPVGVVYEDAEGKRHTEYTQSASEAGPAKETSAKKETVTAKEEVATTEVKEEEKGEVIVTPPPVKEEEVIATTEAKPKPKPTRDHVAETWEKIWDYEGKEGEVIDLCYPKAKWPNEVKSRIQEKDAESFLETMANGTGYFDSLQKKDFGVPPGTLIMAKDKPGRRVVVIVGNKATDGNVVVFDRYSHQKTPLVSHIGETIRQMLGGEPSALTEKDLHTFFGGYAYGENNIIRRTLPFLKNTGKK